MRPIDDIKTMEMDQILVSIADWILYEGRTAITWAEIQNLLRTEPYFYVDERTHRKKRQYLEANGYLKRVNRVAYKITEQGLARVRKVKGVPETLGDAHDASNDASDTNTGPEVLEHSHVCQDVPATDPSWTIIEQLILQRDAHKCRICGGTGNGRPGYLRVRPKHPGESGTPTDSDDLVTLCEQCDRAEQDGIDHPTSQQDEAVAEVSAYMDAIRRGSI